MRTRTISLALAIVLIFPFASAQWVKQNSGTTKTLYGVYFTDRNTGTVVGDSGIMLRTTNGGAAWIAQSSGTAASLSSISFVDANIGTVVGDSGIILRTTNGGITWTPQSSGTKAKLTSVTFADANTGTAVGDSGIILRTTNGGTTWATQSSGTAVSLTSVFFVGANTGTAVGNAGTILRTTNGGASWANQSVSTGDDLRDVWFTDGMKGTAVGSWGAYLHTADGGTTWTKSGQWYWLLILSGVCFTDADSGTVVGWTTARSADQRGFRPADGTSTDGGFPGQGPPGLVWRTTDGGATWMMQSPVPAIWDALLAVCFTDANNGTAVGRGGTIVRTTNGGVTSVEGEELPGVPKQYLLKQNYPNPFNPSTTIKYELPKSSEVRLSVSDMLGREVSILVNEKRDAGVHEVRFDGSGLSSGVYFYRLQAGTYVETRKLLVLR
jgi:photosystem II stability/assembly factor-like uncharacterized protein